jgi:hypothetical protein
MSTKRAHKRGQYMQIFGGGLAVQCGMRLWAVSTVYAGVAFAAGFVLGTVRVLVLEPWLGEVGAVLVEGPVMLGVSYVAARWVVARWMRDASRGRRVAMGFIALAMLLLAELAIAPVVLRDAEGGWLRAFAGKFATAAGVIGAVWQLLFAVMPAGAGPKGGNDGGA